MSIADLSPQEFTTLVQNAQHFKTLVKSGKGLSPSLRSALAGQTLALTFTKRSTRTRVSTEAAIALLGGHPMFLGSGDIQLGVNESLHDTSVVISSMVAGIFARVNGHEDVLGLAQHSSVPVINALSDAFHPLQTVADFLTLTEAFPTDTIKKSTLGLEGRKLAWIGDANNVLFDLALGCAHSGVDLAVATPHGYEIPSNMHDLISQTIASSPSTSNRTKLTSTTSPIAAAKDADVLVTDTWISMGQESDSQKRLKDFAGYQITHEMAREAGARENWKFMHCLPRHQDEVDDKVFYDPVRSLVFPEAENRLWAALAVLEAFVVKKGKIVDATLEA
jgi:ornithine carbamoyltransferase